MTLFEYLAIAFSLVLSSAAMRFVGGLPDAFDRSRRYWPHLGFVGVGLLTVAATFWVYWSYRDVSWNFLKFLVALTHLGTVYFLAVTLVPASSSAVTAWRDYYYSVRVRYFSAVIFLGLATSLNATLLLGMPIGHPARWPQLATLAIGVTGLSSANPRLHGALASVSCVLSVLAVATIFMRASALTQ